MDNDFFEATGNLDFCHRKVFVDEAGKRHVESSKANHAFMEFCKLGDARSVQGVAKVLSKSRTLINRWCQRWNWRERVREYDARMHEADVAGSIRARKQMADRQSRGAVLGQNIALQALIELQQRLQARGNVRPLTAHEAVRLFESCSRIERICRGEPNTEDVVAAIHVHLELQKQSRYQDAADAAAIDPKKDFDS